MTMNWHLQDAKNNFSKLVQRARTEGPQTVTVRGEPAVVVLSTEDYEKLAGKKKAVRPTALLLGRLRREADFPGWRRFPAQREVGAAFARSAEGIGR